MIFVTIDAAGSSPDTVLTVPGDGRVKRGSSIVLQCKHSVSTRRSESIVWYRRNGDVQHQLGVEDLVVAEFGTTGAGLPRVKITRRSLPDSLESNLTISGMFRLLANV